MANDSGSNVDGAKQKIALGKILLRQYQVLSGFHQAQLENYPKVCCNISLYGEVEIDPVNKTAIYYVKTSKFYKSNKNKELIRRSKYSLYSIFGIPNVRYEKEQKLANINLTAWTTELLWPETKVTVHFDVEPDRTGE